MALYASYALGSKSVNVNVKPVNIQIHTFLFFSGPIQGYTYVR